jgi:hypothetical protein
MSPPETGASTEFIPYFEACSAIYKARVGVLVV